MLASSSNPLFQQGSWWLITKKICFLPVDLDSSLKLASKNLKDDDILLQYCYCSIQKSLSDFLQTCNIRGMYGFIQELHLSEK